MNMPQAKASATYDEMRDEMHADARRGVRAHYRGFQSWLESQSADVIAAKRAEADLTFHRVGITFAVVGDDQGTERLIPFDIIPRIVPAPEWRELEAGLRQRVKALNRFIHDIYHGQSIVKAGVIPPEHIFCNPQYRPEMQGIDVAGDIYAHVAGIDVVRADAGEFYVLVSMDSTLRSNLSVGLPLDLLCYEADSLRVTRFVTIGPDNEYFQMVSRTWGQRLKQAFVELPDPTWAKMGSAQPVRALAPAGPQPARPAAAMQAFAETPEPSSKSAGGPRG